MHDLLWSRPSLQDEYFDDILTIFGHTPTMYYGEIYTGKILKTRTWINIDVGVGSGQPPVFAAAGRLTGISRGSLIAQNEKRLNNKKPHG